MEVDALNTGKLNLAYDHSHKEWSWAVSILLHDEDGGGFIVHFWVSGNSSFQSIVPVIL